MAGRQGEMKKPNRELRLPIDVLLKDEEKMLVRGLDMGERDEKGDCCFLNHPNVPEINTSFTSRRKDFYDTTRTEGYRL